MPMTWQISINPNPAAIAGVTFVFEPNPLADVRVGDQIFWTNNTDQPHWPGIVNYPTYFMPNQIAPNSSSPAFVPDPSVSGQTLTYVDTLPNATGPTATIVISTK